MENISSRDGAKTWSCGVSEEREGFGTHDARRLQKFQIALELDGVGQQVFLLVELEGVDEDGGHDEIVLAAGLADKGEVAFVEGAHRGD